MHARPTLAAVALAILHGGSLAAATPASTPLHHNLPKDPLVVVSLALDDPLGAWHHALDWAGKIGDADTPQRWSASLDELSQRAGLSLESEVLAQLGPQMVVAVDLPPIDMAAIGLQVGQPGAVAAALGQMGLIAEVRDGERLDRGLRGLLALGGGQLSVDEDGTVVATLPLSIQETGAVPASAIKAEMSVHYRIHEGRIALGFSRGWVSQVFASGPPENKLAAGQDFARVFGQLDPAAVRLTYVNLPKIRKLVADSHIVLAVLEANPQTAELVRLLAAENVMDVGLGSTSVPVAGGVRTTNFGPEWISGPVLSSGLVAALAVPALLLASSDGPDDGHATVEHIDEIARACEGFSGDTRRYPRTQGWVPVERIALYLEPVYSSSLPRTDEWENPILYWSDGDKYRILSTGGDGQMDRDWSGSFEPETTADIDGDIVFGDGRYLALPNALGRAGEGG